MVRLQAKFGETEARKIAAREARERRAAAERERLEATADPNLIPLGARAGIKGGMAGAAQSAQPPSWTKFPTSSGGTLTSSRTEATTTCRTGDGT